MCTVNCRRTNECRLQHIGMLSRSLEDDFVDISMEGVVGQIEDLIYPIPVIVHMLAFISVFVLVGVFPGQDACSSGVQPVTWFFLGVASYQAGYDGLCSAHMIGGICCVYFGKSLWFS